MRRNILILYSCLVFIVFFRTPAWATPPPGISISGAVKQTIRLSIEDLAKFHSIVVRLNEVDSAKNFSGVFEYQGVPLRSILELAHIQKEEASFSKFLDIAIVIRKTDGKQIVLSWGEVFYRNPAEIIIAYAAKPIMPELAVGREKWTNTLRRPIEFPKLVVANDFYTDRSMDAIASIEVIVLNPSARDQNASDQYSKSFTISGAVRAPLLISDLSSFPHMTAMIKFIGSGKGYRGLKQVNGVPLVKLLEKAGAPMDLNTVYLITHSDGYRAMLSFGELFLDPQGERILIADANYNQGDEIEGRFTLHIPNDLSSDRHVKGIDRIEVINLKTAPKVYTISVGCADTSLITLEALSYLNKTDAVVCSEDIAKRYAYYIGHRQVLFDPFKVLTPKLIHGKENERKKLRADNVAEATRMIRRALDQGKSVAILEYGDPLIYGASREVNAAFADHEKKYIPGVSAFNAANALIGKEIACKGSIILSSPWSLRNNPVMVSSVAKSGDTLAIFMGLNEIEHIVPLLKRYYQGNTPVIFAFRAGYSNSNHLIKTDLDKAAEAFEKENKGKELWLGIIYVGSCLE